MFLPDANILDANKFAPHSEESWAALETMCQRFGWQRPMLVYDSMNAHSLGAVVSRTFELGGWEDLDFG
jgi:hypothetical protein